MSIARESSMRNQLKKRSERKLRLSKEKERELPESIIVPEDSTEKL